MQLDMKALEKQVQEDKEKKVEEFRRHEAIGTFVLLISNKTVFSRSYYSRIILKWRMKCLNAM